jgi:hypothetical protein
MKRYIIGALVGALLVFGWQTVGHLLFRYHDAGLKQVANQENVINTLSGLFTEEGQYLIPRSPSNASQEEMAKFSETIKGKPWAIVTYHTSYNNNMGLAIVRSFVTAFICVLLFIAILGRNAGSFSSVFFKGLGIGALMFLFVWYNNDIWFQTPWEFIRGELIDLLVAWGLCGLWLGWWLNRRTKKYA